jgi:hypothetical protein
MIPESQGPGDKVTVARKRDPTGPLSGFVTITGAAACAGADGNTSVAATIRKDVNAIRRMRTESSPDSPVAPGGDIGSRADRRRQLSLRGFAKESGRRPARRGRYRLFGVSPT